MKKKTVVKKPRNRAAQDITLINLRPIKEDIRSLRAQLKDLILDQARSVAASETRDRALSIRLDRLDLLVQSKAPLT